MQIQINQNWLIETLDSLNIGVFQKKKNNNKKSEKYGEEYWDCIGYYGSLESALDGFVKKSGVPIEANNLEELKSGIQAIHDDIKRFCDTYKSGFNKVWAESVKRTNTEPQEGDV